MIDAPSHVDYDRRMLARQRYSVILSALEKGAFIALRDAAALTGASEATIRRDFLALEREGLVVRHRGGVEGTRRSGASDAGPGRSFSSTPLVSLPLATRLAVREEAKRLIAERAARICEAGQTVFLDAGSTTFRLAEILGSSDLRIITNSFAAARLVLEKGTAEVIVTGGQIDRSSRVVYSYVDDPVVEAYPADIAFLSAQGVDSAGVWNSDERLTRLERAAVRHARTTVLLADSSKFGTRGRIRVCGLEAIGRVVTDAGIGAEYRELVRAAGCELLEVR